MKVFLLDADVIIWCAENNKIDALFKNREIKIPKKIFEEVEYRRDPVTQEKQGIDLKKYIEDGCLEVIDSVFSETIKKVRKTYKICPQLAEIQDGEIECIALLMKNPDYKFCTGDVPAMRVVGFYGLSEQAISLEKLVGKIKALRDDFKQKCMTKNLKIGSSLRAQYFDKL